MARIDVRKTAKLYLGGEFPRSESGHTYEVFDASGSFVANAAKASRKDARDAVVKARAAFAGWSGRTAYNRGQIIYRLAELVEERRTVFAALVREAEGMDSRGSMRQLDAAIDRLVWYAGWSDKITQVTGSANPVAGPFFNVSSPDPTGVVVVLAPQQSSLLGLISVLAPVIVTGNTAIVLASETRPLPAVALTEAMATSDFPAGVVNLLTGPLAQTAPTLAAHMDVNAIDLTGAAGRVDDLVSWQRAAVDNLKRVVMAPEGGGDDGPDWYQTPGLDRMTAFLETRTVWHPVGL